MGEFTGRTGNNGHLSTIGMMAGGSGYIIGKNALTRLASHTIVEETFALTHPISDPSSSSTSSSLSSTTFSFAKSTRENRPSHRNRNHDVSIPMQVDTSTAWSDTYRSSDQITYLSVSKEARKLASMSVTASKSHSACHGSPDTASTSSTSSSTLTSSSTPITSHSWIDYVSAICFQSDSALATTSHPAPAFLQLPTSSSVSSTSSMSSTSSSSSTSSTSSVSSVPAPAVERVVARGERRVQLKSRLIDACVLMMASEHTCLHR